jgi:hypothetical protein
MNQQRWIAKFLPIGIALFLFACNSDKAASDNFKGKYTVKVVSVNLKELEDASSKAKVEMEKGKEELKQELEKAKKELDANAEITIDGQKVDLKEAMGKMGDGLGKMMEGMEDLGKSFEGFGKSITETIVKSTVFKANFQEDGVLSVGSDNNSFNFSSKTLKWRIENDKLIITDEDKNKENFSFDMKANNDKEWELTNDKMTLKLSKSK